MKTPILLLMFPLLACAAGPSIDHSEFDATLYAPYRAPPSGARTFTLSFDYPHLPAPLTASWRLDIAHDGKPFAEWTGEVVLRGEQVAVDVPWKGAGEPGIYTVRMTARAGESEEAQEWDVLVGAPPSVRSFAPMVTAAMPWDVYLGNLHSQTNDSDGGGALTACHEAQPPQSAPFGPRDAWTYARGRGLDFLLTSEHNHLYDGSTGTNKEADPDAARARFHHGLADAFDFSATHAGFLALYGLEWGVISNGGHLNILDGTELLGWEAGKGGALVADTVTPRSDYANLYRLSRRVAGPVSSTIPPPAGSLSSMASRWATRRRAMPSWRCAKW